MNLLASSVYNQPSIVVYQNSEIFSKMPSDGSGAFRFPKIDCIEMLSVCIYRVQSDKKDSQKFRGCMKSAAMRYQCLQGNREIGKFDNMWYFNYN